MSISILRGTNDKPASSHALAAAMKACTSVTGRLFIGYPIVRASDGPCPIDALLVSPDQGIVVFDLIEGSEPGDYASRQDDAANMLEARLKTHRELTQRRELRIPIHALSFASGVSLAQPPDAADEYPLVTSDALKTRLGQYRWEDPERNELYERGLSAIENISTIRAAGKRRASTQPGSRGARLKRLEASIATMDHEQGRAVVETVEGVQRIRGLAGSGKTIVLALKAAYLHVQHPEWRIGVTFHTRSLKGYFRRLISNFCVEQTGEEPDWSHMRVVNSWGSPSRGGDDGLYLEFCSTHDIEYMDFRGAKQHFGSGNAAFAGACRTALERFQQCASPKSLYDAILVDEAQDLPDTFLQICYALLHDPRRLVYAYDELQNLTGTAVSTPEAMFGADANGRPRVQLDADGSDIILQKCYRNSRPVLVTAHALGFGVYRQPAIGEDTGLTQMFDNAPLWQEIGYRVQAGELRDGYEVTLARTTDTSPKFLEAHSGIDDLVQFVRFDSKAGQSEWVATEIRNNLERDELRYDDIVVINPNPLTTRDEVGPIRARLLDFGINSHVAGVDTSADEFYRADEDSVTFTGVYRAKGNEAGMVYVVNSQDCHGMGRNLASIRNRLFVAITRSKAWVRVVGVGPDMTAIEGEYHSVRERDFELRFTYPTEEQRGRLRLIHRDMTTKERNRVQKHRRDLDQLISDLESGLVHKEDLNSEQLAALRTLLDG
jgi:superfamily I DNA and RNA helicase